jgi:hypothetical protein
MNIAIKIKLSSGKEIELSKEEYEEVKDFFTTERGVQYITYIPNIPFTPWNPEVPWYPTEPYVTCTHSGTIGDTPTVIDLTDREIKDRIVYKTTTGNNWD